MVGSLFISGSCFYYYRLGAIPDTVLTFACDTILSLPGPAVWIFLHVMSFLTIGNQRLQIPIRSGIRDHLKIVKKHL